MPGLRNLKTSESKEIKKYPLLPIRFYSSSGQTPIIEALIDSGADGIHIHKSIVDFLNLSKGQKLEITGMSGTYSSFETKVGLKLGQGGREMDFGYVKAVYPEEEKYVPVLIGRHPLFEEFNQQFKLIPKEELLKKEKMNVEFFMGVKERFSVPHKQNSRCLNCLILTK